VRTRISVAVLLLSLGTLIALDRYGKSRRVHSDRARVLEVARPEQAYEVWKESGASGRTLLLFAAFPHLWTGMGPGSLGPESFVTRAALDNVVRRIYVVVPDDAWDQFYGVDLPGFFRRAPPPERSVYLRYSLGLPVIATTVSSLPPISEPSLVYVDRRRFELSYVQELLSARRIPSDTIVASTGL
jgi:hypothetical protein